VLLFIRAPFYVLLVFVGIVFCLSVVLVNSSVTPDAPGVTLAGHSRASGVQAGHAYPPVSARQGASVSNCCIPVAHVAGIYAPLHVIMTVPRHRLSTYGRLAFAVAGPTMFNALPDDLRDPAVSTTTFGQSMKTQFFSAYQHV